MFKAPNDVEPIGWEGYVSRYSNLNEMITLYSDDYNNIVGCFVQIDLDKKKCTAAQKHSLYKINSAAITKPLVGVVLHQLMQHDVGNISIRYSRGNTYSVLLKGWCHVKLESAATAGKYIHLKKSDGTIVLDDKKYKDDQHYATEFMVLHTAAANQYTEIVRL